MAEKVRHSLTFARAAGLELLDMFRPAIHEGELAGSIRRCAADVGDIELVLRPRIESVPDPSDLFASRMVERNLQWELASKLRTENVLVDRLDVNRRPAFGQKYQRVCYRGIPVDVFCVTPPAQFGVIMFIRTGPADFSHRCVTQRADGGKVLDAGMRVLDGQLWDRGRPVETPTEISFFDAIGLEYIRPEDRK